MKTKVILSLLVLLVIMACDKDKEDKDHQLMILGRWVETNHVPTGVCCDTFEFHSNGEMDILSQSDGQTHTYSYEILSDDAIKIDDFAGNRTLEYNFNSSFTNLIIKKYFESLIWQDDKDLVLQKIE